MRPQFASLLKQPYTRRTLMAVVLSSSMLPAVRADYEAEILSENPVVYYRFDDGVTVDSLDPTVATNLGSVAAAGNGAFVGNATRGVAGAVSGDDAIEFAQVNPLDINFVGSMNVPNIAALNPSHTGTNPFTVECWVKPKNAVSTLLSPVNSMSFTTGRAGYLIYQNAGTWQLRLGNKASTTAAIVLDGGTVTPGVWQHLSFTYSGGTNGTATLYVDGVAVGSAVASGVGYEANDNAPFVIGATSAPNRTFDGAVDEVAFHPSALSAARLLDRVSERSANPAGYQAHVLADSPVGYWRLNEAPFVAPPPPVAVNAGSLGATANGAYFAGSKNVSGGPSPSSGFLGFGATNSSLGLATANGHVGTPYNLNALTSYTVMGWVKRGALKSTRGGYFGQNDKLEFGDAGGGTQIEAWTGGSGSLYAPYAAPDDQWTFITYVADGSTNRLYVDGVEAVAVAGGVGGTSAFNFNVGGGGIFNGTGDYFLGEIDEVAVFDKAVTPGRVKQLFDAALGNVAPGLVNTFPSISPPGEIPEGLPYTLSIDPTGTPPFTYQWKVNGEDIPLATERTYTVPAASANSPNPLDPFVYTVVVTNGTDFVTSDPADVYVTPTLRWTSTDPTHPGKWDIGTLAPPALNWEKFTGGAASAYTDDFAVLFDDSATATAVELTQDVVPKGVIFDNSTKDYTTSGPFLISTPFGGGLVKKGTGTVEIGNDILNVDTVTVNDGVLRVGNGTTGAMTAITVASVPGGELQIHHASGTPYETATVVTGGLLSFGGPGDFSTSQTANITGPGNVLFEGSGTIVVGGPTLVGGTVTIDSGTVVFDGNQQANRLAAGKVVTVNPGAVMEIRGVNALPTGLNSVSPQLNQSTLKVISGFSVGAPTSGSHAHLGNVVLDGSSVILGYSGSGGVYNGESFQLNGNISVTGSAASSIANDGTGNAGNAGMALSSGATEVVHTVTVDNVAAGTDLTIATEIENSDSATPANAVLAKTGTGTLSLAGGIAHSFSGTTRVDEGTLEATGSVAGPLVIGSSGTIAPGTSVGTFAAGATTLGGIYACEIDGFAADKLVVNGNLTLSPGAQIAFSVLGGGVTAPFYEVVSCTGTISGPLPSVTGVPVGYSLTVVSSSSLVLVQNGFAAQPTIAAAPSSGSEDFNTNGGGFTVSAPVSPETDWAYTTGSWRSNAQASGFGTDNTSYLISPIYTLTQAGAATLTFTHRHSFEADFDGGAVDVSVNGAAFTRIATPSFSQNPYNGALGAVGHSLQNGEAYVGNSAGHPAFITSVCTLTNGAVGDTVQVRFISASDNNTTGNLTPAGWEIDSIVVSGGKPSLMALDWPFGTMQYSDNLLPPWTDLPGSGPLLIDTNLAPKRFFRLKP
jgi:autotransporter-associated beta strand protein